MVERKIEVEKEIKLNELSTLYLYLKGTIFNRNLEKENLLEEILKIEKSITPEEILRTIKTAFDGIQEDQLTVALKYGNKNYFLINYEQEILKSYQHIVKVYDHEVYYNASAKYEKSNLTFSFAPELLEKEDYIEFFTKEEGKRISTLKNRKVSTPLEYGPVLQKNKNCKN